MENAKLNELAGRAAAGDNRAWERFYQSAAKLTTAVCRKKSLSPEATEDIIQEVMLALSTRMEELSRMKNPEGYVRRVAKSKCINYLTAENRVPTERFHDDGLLLNVPDSTPTPDDVVAGLSRGDLLLHYMEKLPEEQRHCLRLRYMEGYTNRQIAEKLHIPVGTVASRIRYAKKLIAKQVKTFEKQYHIPFHAKMAVPFMPWRLLRGQGDAITMLAADSTSTEITRVISGAVAAVVMGGAVIGSGVTHWKTEPMPSTVPATAAQTAATTFAAVDITTAAVSVSPSSAPPTTTPATEETEAPETTAMPTEPAVTQREEITESVTEPPDRHYQNITFDDIVVPASLPSETIFTQVENPDSPLGYTYEMATAYYFSDICDRMTGTCMIDDTPQPFVGGTTPVIDIDPAQGTDGKLILNEGDNLLRFYASDKLCEIHVRVDGEIPQPVVTDLWVYLDEETEGMPLLWEPRFTAVLHDASGEHTIGNDHAEIPLDGLVIDEYDSIPTLSVGYHVLKTHFLGAEGDFRLRIRKNWEKERRQIP